MINAISPADMCIYGVRCIDVTNMLQRHIFQFPSVRDSVDCVSSGRLREVKNNKKLKKSSLKVVAYERWSLTRGGRKGRFDCSESDV